MDVRRRDAVTGAPESAGAPPRLMVVVAHPDDETFGCGSLLLDAAARGAATFVVCATRGEAGEGGRADQDLAVIRERELHAAAGVLRVSRVDLLDFGDSGMRGEVGPRTLAGAPLAAVRDAVLARIEALQPHVVVTLDGGDGHRDHQRIRDATLAAVDAARWPVERVYLQCLPQSLMRRWLDTMARADPSREHLHVDVPGTPDELLTTVVDTSDFVAWRRAAIRMHASQKSPYDDLADDLRDAFLTAEHLQRVRPTWDGSPPERCLLPTAAAVEHVRVWRYDVVPERVEEFVAGYGRDGTWAQLFSTTAGYLGTELHGSPSQPNLFVTIDRFRSEDDWHRFVAVHHDDYERLDESCRALTIDEEQLYPPVSR